MNRRTSPKLPWLILSLLVTITATIPTAYYTIPHVLRWRMLKGLTSTHIPTREKALNYLIIHAREDNRLLAGAVTRLDVTDQDNFLQLLGALDHAGLWRRPDIPPEPWLRWITILAHDPADESRITAAQLLAAAPDLADTARTQSLLRSLVNDDLPDVRYNTLAAAAELLHAAAEPDPFNDIIASATDDSNPTIAGQAWIMVGLIHPTSALSARWRNRPPQVAQAILWATLKTNPRQPLSAIQALADHTLPLSVQATAAYALHHSRTPQATTALAARIAPGAQNVTEKNQVILWRAILAIDHTTDPGRRALEQFLSSATPEQLDDPLIRPLILAALTRHGPHPNFHEVVNDPLVTLALMHANHVGGTNQSLPIDPAPLLILAEQTTTAHPDPATLRPLFASPMAPMRDRACLLAADRFTDQQNTTLIESLLNDFNDDAKGSGAILAGLTGLNTDLLSKKCRDEDIWAVAQIMRLGLWMQSTPQADRRNGFYAPSLLTRQDIPKSTVLLALLHHRHPAALDYLLNPRGDQAPDLLELLDQHRWWPVLERFLPDDGLGGPGGPAPRLWVWADPELERFQLDLLREWYLINRWRLLQRSP